ncbi:MAG: tRNA (N(6)-L-threonylcarbamoyladenosine(37)-C(2))-methylthiotransferase MtaB [Paramuribaculum sp.]|nr:tRNA (N(6)-L-threonylcarbamoyladenosine(37)-C(2))-methylthiotransferase MtaB [Paramuribaculum sp.]
MTDPQIFQSYKALYHTFGCKLNFAETATLASRLAECGIERAKPGEEPDIIVINSCSVTELADKKCRQTIRSLARRHPKAGIAVTGCYAQLKPQEVKELPGVVVVAGADQKDRVPQLITQWLERGEEKTEVTAMKDISRFIPSCSRGDRTRYFLKVQDGCNYFCSYCTIPMARGRSRSGEIGEIVEQARQVAAAGGKEIVITGVNTGDFGYGRKDTFFDLIRRLDEVEGIERYRISSIEPNLLTDEMIRWVAGSRAFMPHFHIPLQSGDDEVLKLMRRRYDTALFRHRIETIRTEIPDAFIGVDLIVGARGETEERFESSRSFVESLAISRLHVFPYSERPGTRAIEDIEYVVSQEEKHRRSRTMIEISDRKLMDFTMRFAGTVRPVLVEHTTHSDGTMAGFTDNYLKVRIDASPEQANTVVAARLSPAPKDSEFPEELIATQLS